jgi:hypothetical protein
VTATSQTSRFDQLVQRSCSLSCSDPHPTGFDLPAPCTPAQNTAIIHANEDGSCGQNHSDFDVYRHTNGCGWICNSGHRCHHSRLRRACRNTKLDDFLHASSRLYRWQMDFKHDLVWNTDLHPILHELLLPAVFHSSTICRSVFSWSLSIWLQHRRSMDRYTHSRHH